MQMIAQRKGVWTLYREESRWILSVVCGTVGIFTREVELAAAEIRVYENQGAAILDSLAEKIRERLTER